MSGLIINSATGVLLGDVLDEGDVANVLYPAIFGKNIGDGSIWFDRSRGFLAHLLSVPRFANEHSHMGEIINLSVMERLEELSIAGNEGAIAALSMIPGYSPPTAMAGKPISSVACEQMGYLTAQFLPFLEMLRMIEEKDLVFYDPEWPIERKELPWLDPGCESQIFDLFGSVMNVCERMRWNKTWRSGVPMGRISSKDLVAYASTLYCSSKDCDLIGHWLRRLPQIEALAKLLIADREAAPDRRVDFAKRTAKKLLKIAKERGGCIRIESLAGAQEIVSRLAGDSSWHEMRG